MRREGMLGECRQSCIATEGKDCPFYRQHNKTRREQLMSKFSRIVRSTKAVKILDKSAFKNKIFARINENPIWSCDMVDQSDSTPLRIEENLPKL